MIRRRAQAWRWLLASVALLVLWLGVSPSAAAEDRVIVRGNYYRETSTRVLSPEVKVTVDAPDERLTLGAAYLLDAVSSASIATGTAVATGGDNVFTELRHEATGSIGSRLGKWQLGTFFRYSTETDYVSRSTGLSVGRDFLQNSVNLSLSYAYNFDRVFRIFDSNGRRLPWCGGSIEPNCTGGGRTDSNLLQVHYLAAGYTHAVHKTVLLLGTLEYGNIAGPQDNAYRGMQIPGVTFESHPLERNRFALFGSLRWHVPRARVTLEPRYRFYADDWDLRSHAPELRLHVRATTHLRLRFRYRFYIQNESFFWRDDMMYQESDLRCSRSNPEGCASADPKMDDWLSHTGGIQLTYHLDGLAKYEGMRWLEGAWVQATYNYVHQTNRFGPIRALGSLAFSLAF
jgi:hypothetical protein